MLCIIPVAEGAGGNPQAPPRVVNVRDFGAKADGKTDDWQAIQKAIKKVGRSGGGRVLLPPSKHPYLITKGVGIYWGNVEIYGPGATIKMADGPYEPKALQHCIRISGSRKGRTVLPLRRVAIRGVTIDVNFWSKPNANYPRGIYAEFDDGLVIEEVTIRRAGVGMTFGEGMTNSQARDCLITEWFNDAYNVTGARRNGISHAHHIRFVRCRASGSPNEKDGGPRGKRDNAWEIEDGAHDIELIDCVAENAGGQAFGIRNHAKKRDHRPVDTHSVTFTRCRAVKMTRLGWCVMGGGRYDDRLGMTDPLVHVRNVRLVDCRSDTRCAFSRGARDITITGGSFTGGVLVGMGDDTEKGRKPPAQVYGVSISGAVIDVLKVNLTPGKIGKRAVLHGTGPLEAVAEQPSLKLSNVRVLKVLEVVGDREQLATTNCVLPE